MTLPSIPDNSYKFLLYVGIILIGYSFLQTISANESYNNQVQNSNSHIDSLTIRELMQKKNKDLLIEIASDLSLKHNIENPISDKDSIVYFNKTLTGPKNYIIVTDTLRKIWNDFKDGNFEIELINEHIKMTKAQLKEAGKENDQVNYFYFALAIFGILCSVGGIAGMEKNQNLQEKLIQIEIAQKEVKYNFCQSCGANFSSMRKHGQELNKEKNPAFCSECFVDGQFREPDLTLEEFKKRTKVIIESCDSKTRKKRLIERFKNLERWKPSDYT